MAEDKDYQPSKITEPKKGHRTEFDPSLSPMHPNNQEAAQERGLIYDERRGFYVDEDGCLILDRFGQLL